MLPSPPHAGKPAEPPLEGDDAAKLAWLAAEFKRLQAENGELRAAAARSRSREAAAVAAAGAAEASAAAAAGRLRAARTQAESARVTATAALAAAAGATAQADALLAELHRLAGEAAEWEDVPSPEEAEAAMRLAAESEVSLRPLALRKQLPCLADDRMGWLAIDDAQLRWTAMLGCDLQRQPELRVAWSQVAAVSRDSCRGVWDNAIRLRFSAAELTHGLCTEEADGEDSAAAAAPTVHDIDGERTVLLSGLADRDAIFDLIRFRVRAAAAGGSGSRAGLDCVDEEGEQLGRPAAIRYQPAGIPLLNGLLSWALPSRVWKLRSDAEQAFRSASYLLRKPAALLSALHRSAAAALRLSGGGVVQRPSEEEDAEARRLLPELFVTTEDEGAIVGDEALLLEMLLPELPKEEEEEEEAEEKEEEEEGDGEGAL